MFKPITFSLVMKTILYTIIFSLIAHFSVYYFLPELRFNYEDTNMSNIFFERNQANLDKYGIKTIKVRQLNNTETIVNIDYKKAGFKNQNFRIETNDINCYIHDNIFIDNKHKTLTLNEHDIAVSGKQYVFEKTEECLNTVIKGIDKYLKQEHNLTEKFELKEDK